MPPGFIKSLAIIYPILFISLLVLAGDQVVFDEQANQRTHGVGILRRFGFSHDQQREQVLRSAFDNGVDIWQLTNSHIDIYTSFHDQSLPAELINIPHTHSIIEAPPSQIKLTTPADWRLEFFADSKYHEHYHPLYEIVQFMQELAELHPDTVKLTNIGHSGEGREMLAMTFSAPVNSTLRPLPGPGKLGFVVGGAQHAREWVATAASTYLAHALVADPSEPHSLRHLLDNFDFHIVPVPNPDGYAYTWEADRYWYKNRQIIGPHLKCVGVDMNRNWGYKWKPRVGDVPMLNGSSNFDPKEPIDPCSHWYPGHRPFEAPEVNNIANFITTLPNLVGFMDLRNYGQMLSAPFSYTCNKLPKDAEDQIEAATGATGALRSVHGVYFQTGGLCDLLYPAPGNIVDWMYKVAHIKFSYVAHLRDTGTYGFSLPESWIRPVGEETAKMIEYLCKFIPTHIRRKF